MGGKCPVCLWREYQVTMTTDGDLVHLLIIPSGVIKWRALSQTLGLMAVITMHSIFHHKIANIILVHPPTILDAGWWLSHLCADPVCPWK